MAMPSLVSIAKEYRDINGTQLEVWTRPPTALEFSRLVHISRPVLFKSCFGPGYIPALDKWSDEYLCARMGPKNISVAVTPDGYADAVKRAPDGLVYFTEPLAESMTIAELLRRLGSCPQQSSRTHNTVVTAPSSIQVAPTSPGGISTLRRAKSQEEVVYLQSQNGNLNAGGEFEALKGDFPSEIDWASEALGRGPEAVNLWIGDQKSVTSVHSDPYENVYTLIRGKKHFTLLPPSEGWSLQERAYPHAKYVRDGASGQLIVKPTSPAAHVSWASLDPFLDLVHIREEAGFEVHPLEVTLSPGDALYLPAGWWHHVRQEGDGMNGVGPVIALNWWYDMEMRGISWVWLSLLRDRPVGEDEEDG